METCVYHTPVLLEPSVDGLNVHGSGVYVDVTLGGGGHSREILRRLGSGGRLFSFDQDRDAIAKCQMDNGQWTMDNGQWTMVHSNFRYLGNWMRYYGVDSIDGLIADLGVSGHHLDAGERGFSFRWDATLDMRMNRAGGMTAADVVNSYDVDALCDVLMLYGELKGARRIADAIVKARARGAIRTTGELARIVDLHDKKDLARMFQALRIEVNHEMDALRDMLMSAVDLLAPGGRLVVLSYHSLEDRIVKRVMRCGSDSGEMERDVFGNSHAPLRPIGKAVVPTAEEVARNPRSRSAKLRIAEKRGCAAVES